MLYASTTQSDLSIVKLTLSSISSKKRVPAPLRDRFVKIVLDAMKIQEDPKDIPKSMETESIDLAIQMLENDLLKKSLSTIHDRTDVEQLTVNTASTALQAMGNSSAH
jgi:hypothetical protein